jgi:hypothetical protein
LGALIDIYSSFVIEDVDGLLIMSAVSLDSDDVPAAPQALGIGGAILVRKEQVLQRFPEAEPLIVTRYARFSGAICAFYNVDAVARNASPSETLHRLVGILPVLKKCRDRTAASRVHIAITHHSTSSFVRV